MLWKFLHFYRRFLALRTNLLFKPTAKFLQMDFRLQFVLYCICLSFLLTSLQSQLNGRRKTTSDNDWQHIPQHEGGSMWAHKCIAIMLRCFPPANSCDEKTLARTQSRSKRNLSSRMFFLLEGCVTPHLNMQLKICGTDTCQRRKAAQKLEGGFFSAFFRGKKMAGNLREQTKWIMKNQMNIYNRILDPWSPARQQLRTVFVSLCQFPKRHSLLTAYLKNAISLSDRMTWWNDKWN